MKNSLVPLVFMAFSAHGTSSVWDVKFCFTNKEKVSLHCYKQRDDLYSFDFFLDTNDEKYHFYNRRPAELAACLHTKNIIKKIINEEKYCILGEKILDSEERISITLDKVEGKNQFWSYFE